MEIYRNTNSEKLLVFKILANFPKKQKLYFIYHFLLRAWHACLLHYVTVLCITLGKGRSHKKKACETNNAAEWAKTGKMMFLLIFFCLASLLSVWSYTKYAPKLLIPFYSCHKCAKCHSKYGDIGEQIMSLFLWSLLWI